MAARKQTEFAAGVSNFLFEYGRGTVVWLFRVISQFLYFVFLRHVLVSFIIKKGLESLEVIIKRFQNLTISLQLP